MQNFCKFIVAFCSDFVALMSGIASVVLAFVGIAMGTRAPNTAVWTAAALCFLFASYRVWLKGHNKAIEAVPTTENPNALERFARIKRKFFSLDKWNQMLVREMLVARSMTNRVAIDFLRRNGHDPGPDSRPMEELNFGTDWFPFNNGEYSVSPAVVEELKAISSGER